MIHHYYMIYYCTSVLLYYSTLTYFIAEMDLMNKTN